MASPLHSFASSPMGNLRPRKWLHGSQDSKPKVEDFKNEKDALIERLREESSKIKTYDIELEKLKKYGTTLAVSKDSYPEILKIIHSQRVQLSIDLAGLEARYDAIAIAIAEASKKQSEEVLKPYKRLVEVRYANLKQVKKLLETGSASSEKLRMAEVELLESRLRLAEASKPSGSLSHLNSQLLDASLERAEKTARLEKANSLFKDVEEYRTFKTTYTTTQRDRNSVLMHRRELEQRKDEH